MKKTIIIFIVLVFIKTSNAQKIDHISFEPNRIKITKTYKAPQKLNIDLLIKDSRTTSKAYSEKVMLAIGNFIKESYPNTNIKLTQNLRKTFNPESNKIIIKIDIIDYSVVRRANQWYAQTTIDVIALDLRDNNIKRFKERIRHTSTQNNKNGARSAKQALHSSFKIAIAKSANYIENSIRGQNKYEVVQKTNAHKNAQTDNNLIPKEKLAASRTEDKFVSDVDVNIPLSTEINNNRFALIIGNEDYNSYQKGLTSEANVEFAERDALTFKEYTEKTLGVPEENIIFMINAQVVEFSKSIEKMNTIAKNLNGEAEIYFYYAGHGFPDEETKEPFLIPVDVSGTDLNYAISLTDVFTKLTEHPSKRVTVFMDACFSGGARNQGLVATRGIKVQPKENLLKGNLIVFTASSGTQSSLPYKEKQHGLFTYYLLKKLQETKGKVSMLELSNYLNKQVAIKSVMINDKEQNPQVNISSEVENKWKEWTFR